MSSAFLMLFACKADRFTRYDKSFFHFEETYNPKDSLYLSDYIVYAIAEEPKFRLKVPVHSDSLLNILKNSLDKLELPLKFIQNGTNYAKWSYFTDMYLDYKTVNTSLLLKSANRFKDKMVVFPVLQLYFRQRTNLDPSRTVYPKFHCHLSLAVFVVKNKKIMYYNQVRHYEIVDKEHHPYDFEDYHVPIPQKQWNDMVNAVFKEYVERLVE